MSALRIAVMGAAGRMGMALIQAVVARDGAVLVSATEADGSEAIGRDAGELAGVGALGVEVSADANAAIAAADAVLDFTRPGPTIRFANIAADLGKVHIVGTTGFSADQEAEVTRVTDRIAMVKAGNMSLGVNLLTALTRKVAAALDEDFDIEILEMHHRHKVDAPSGTALMLGQAAADGRGVSLDEASVRVRDGETGPRRRGDIGFATLRGGSVVGEHSAIFAADGERVLLSHVATDRNVFARGAVAAAIWAEGRPPGLYSMLDVLGFSETN